MTTPSAWNAVLGSALIAAAAVAACADVLGDSESHREVKVTECVTCHRDDYQSTRLPPHSALFSVDCVACHETVAWAPATYSDHRWPLAGAHEIAPCNGCHIGDPPLYEGTPQQCVACHHDDYDASPFPGHDGFPTTCESCHGVSGWIPAQVQHDFWPLTGAHAGARCASCHGNPPVYAGTPRECVGCHRDDYDRSPYPGHNFFPTTCNDCHTTQGWTPAAGGHPDRRFPLTGPHGGIQCGQCHDATLGPNAATNTNCVGCHEGVHARSIMDEKHREVSGYPRGAAPPSFCLECHPSGRND